jgi:hypothetical protein
VNSARLGVHRLPTVVDVTRAPAPRRPAPTRGLAIGTNGRGARIVLDVNAGVVAALDEAGVRTDDVAVACAQDPLTPGLVAVDDAGRRALVMSSRTLHEDSTLLLVDLDAHTAKPVHALAGPGWIVGAFGRESLVVVEQRLGAAPAFRVVVDGRVVWSLPGMQQPSLPALLDDELLALLVCPAPDPVTLTGPSSLCVLDLVHGTLAPLLPAEGCAVRWAEGVLVVEGGAEIVRVRVARGRPR